MFLFTTQGLSEPSSRPAAGSPVVAAIRDAAERTGVSFDYLMRTAERESALDPQAKARTSSATGLFQFIDQTWLATLRAEGGRHGLGEAASAIQQGADGRLHVPDAARRAEIMALRRDPGASAAMAAAFTQRNREQLQAAIGREPTSGELYVAHVLGARGASDLIGRMMSDPARIAARDFPDAAAANRPIFYERGGRPRTVSEVFTALTRAHADLGGATVAEAGARPARGGLLGLFSTAAARAPVSDAVARLWNGPRAQGGARGVEMASLDPAQRFFPMSAATDASAVAAPEPPARLVAAPMPPERPADLAGASQGASAQAAAVHGAGLHKRRQPAGPLNLNAFLKPGLIR
jgi:hypothetical protein